MESKHLTGRMVLKHHMDQPCVIFTARKRCLGQGNVLTPVCHSVHKGGGFPACIIGHMTSMEGLPTGGSRIQAGLHQGDLPRGSLHPGGRQIPPPETRKAGSTHPIGMLSCILNSNKKQRIDPTWCSRILQSNEHQN